VGWTCTRRRWQRVSVVPGPNGVRAQHVQTFGRRLANSWPLRDWLEAHGVTHVAMESTGVYWKPVFYVLEEAFRCLLANAAHIAQVPSRKTDVQDCQWIAQLPEHGLIRVVGARRYSGSTGLGGARWRS
jgi:transposase